MRNEKSSGYRTAVLLILEYLLTAFMCIQLGESSLPDQVKVPVAVLLLSVSSVIVFLTAGRDL